MIQIFGSTHIGKTRPENQDTFGYQILGPGRAYAFVCDGMGGENAGNIASETAKQVLDEQLSQSLDEKIGDASVYHVIASAITTANAKIYSAAQQDASLSGMGTTVALVILLGQKAYYAHVGDSRIYAVRDNLTALTKDHTVVQMLIENGELSLDDAKVHPQRHYITRALGVAPQIEIDTGEVELDQNTILLIASDGLYNCLEDKQIIALTQQCIANTDASMLIESANDQDGSDNITAVIIFDDKLED